MENRQKYFIFQNNSTFQGCLLLHHAVHWTHLPSVHHLFRLDYIYHVVIFTGRSLLLFTP